MEFSSSAELLGTLREIINTIDKNILAKTFTEWKVMLATVIEKHGEYYHK